MVGREPLGAAEIDRKVKPSPTAKRVFAASADYASLKRTLACLVYFVIGQGLRYIQWPKRSNRFDDSRRAPGRFRRENIRERAPDRASTGRWRSASRRRGNSGGGA